MSCFVFSGYCDHRDLHVLTHSFPTRRSSDLKSSVAKKAAAKKPAVAKKAPTKSATTLAKSVAKSPAGLDKFLRQQLAVLEDERATYSRQAASLRAEADLLAAEREPGDVQFDEESGEGDTLAVERRSEEHTSELQSLMRISYAVFCLKKK